jgi:hypothetical protein
MREKSTSAEVASALAAVNPASSTSADDVDAPVGAKNDSSDNQGPDQEPARWGRRQR